ncbi:early nodulin-like protein 1 [Impatiens glandulifera]|uniref:early nodulin-like protein 1 n=1 Tax=Impatiens glandulifera TaxID=253017 RepID=UPI001FB0A572|nr:early nodulin-like protein 1 [Impatiens glandulifera]
MATSILPLLLTILFSVSLSEGREFFAGGHSDSWKIPSSPEDLSDWSGRMRFLIGDSLVWKYDPKSDSVLEVSEEDFNSCNTENPISKHDDGNTKIVLNRSGPFYFISGAEGSCQKGEKIHIRVLSKKHRGIVAVTPAPAPAESEIHAPAPAPAVGGAVALKGGAVMMGLVMGLFVAFV